MHEPDDNKAQEAATDTPDLELRLLVVADTLLALTSLARTDLQRSVAAAPKWVLLSLVRVPLWLMFWLSLSAFLSYLAYVASDSVIVALGALLLLQGGACVLLETGLRSLWRRLSFSETRQALRECAETKVVERAMRMSKNMAEERPREFH